MVNRFLYLTFFRFHSPNLSRPYPTSGSIKPSSSRHNRYRPVFIRLTDSHTTRYVTIFTPFSKGVNGEKQTYHGHSHVCPFPFNCFVHNNNFAVSDSPDAI